MIPDPVEQPVMRVDELARALGISKSTCYAALAVNGGEIPAVRVAGRILCPTAAVRQWLRIDPPFDSGDEEHHERAQLRALE